MVVKPGDEAYIDPYTAGFGILSDAQVEFPGAMQVAQCARMIRRVQEVIKNRPQMPAPARQALQAYVHGLKICNSMWMMQNQAALDESLYCLESFHPMAQEAAKAVNVAVEEINGSQDNQHTG